MITGFDDLRNELVEIFGGHLTPEDIDVAVEALIEEERTTATPALAEINALAQSTEEKKNFGPCLPTGSTTSIANMRPTKKRRRSWR